MFQHSVAGGFGLVESFKGRAGDPDRATALINQSPRRQKTGASVKAWTAGAFMADYERIAFARCAPNFHVLDGTVELQGHRQPVPLVEQHPAQRTLGPTSSLRLPRLIEVAIGFAHVATRQGCGAARFMDCVRRAATSLADLGCDPIEIRYSAIPRRATGREQQAERWISSFQEQKCQTGLSGLTLRPKKA